MNLIPDRIPPLLPPRPSKNDRFRHGIRYLRHRQPNGTVEVEEIPLRPENLLFPQEGDRPVVTDGHTSDCHYLRSVFKSQLVRVKGAVVLCDCRVDFCNPDFEPLGPDVVVMFDVKRKYNWSTFNVDKEGARPMLVVEITSPDSRKYDLKTKVDLYYRANVSTYVIVDRHERHRRLFMHLLGYRRGRRGYVAMKPDKQGRLWLEAAGVWIGITEERAVCFDRDGNRIGDYEEIAQALEQEKKAFEKEKKARTQAEKRLRELEAELRRLRGEA
jgi:hypothetical protein